MSILNDLYYNKHYTSINELFRQAHKLDNEISYSDVSDFCKNQKSYQLHYPTNKHKFFNPIIATDINSDWQIDLIDYSKYYRQNKGYKWIFNCVDVFTRKGFGIAMKNKSEKETAKAFKKILDEFVPPKNMQSDNGNEFLNRSFKEITDKFQINHHTAEPGNHNKNGIIERFNRTLKSKIARHMTGLNTKNWIDVLPSIYGSYNNSRHRTIKMSPNEAMNQRQKIKQIFREKLEDIKLEEALQKPLKKDDHVRIKIQKNVFEKGYSPNWSSEIYTIENKYRNSYKLKENGNPGSRNPPRRFQRHELQKISDFFTVEKILKKKIVNRKTFYLVKWLGYSLKDATWETEANIEDKTLIPLEFK